MRKEVFDIMKEEKVKVICKNCGAESYDIKAKCPNCGAYLYHFYLEEKREALMGKLLKVFLPILIVVIIISGGFLYYNLNRDSVRDDLKAYLEDLKKTKMRFFETDIEEDYRQKVLGFVNGRKHEKLANEFIKKGYSSIEARMEALIITMKEQEQRRKRTPIKEKFRIKTDYYFTKLSFYRNIVPVTEPVEKIHEHLLRYLEFAYKANDLFYKQMDLGYFTNVYETKDGFIRWSYYKEQSEETERYLKYSEEAKREEALFHKELIKLVEVKNLRKYYDKMTFWLP